MNKQIKEYWEKQGYKLYNTNTAQINAIPPVHYYHMNGNGPKVYVAKIEDGSFVYWNYPKWISEEEMLKIIID